MTEGKRDFLEGLEFLKWILSSAESREDALTVIKNASAWLFGLAVFEAAAIYFLRVPFGLFAPLILGAGAFIVRRFRSRVAAMLILSFVGLQIYLVATRPATEMYAAGLAWVGLATFRAVQATVKLKGRFAVDSPADMAAPSSGRSKSP